MEKQKRIKRLAFYFIYGFIGLFLFRLVYGYTLNPQDQNTSEDNSFVANFFDGSIDLKRNYATDKYSNSTVKSDNASVVIQEAPHMPSASEQKFEKIASLKSKTDSFERDEKIIRAKVKRYNSLIQYEHNEGNAPYRAVHFSIGVPPDKFDSMLLDLKKVGNIKFLEVTKTDKTNEYRNINAKKVSLEKTRASLTELTNKPGKIDEYMALSNRILEIEQQLQDLGVALGDFDSENEFCTVRFSLNEFKKAEPIRISTLHRIKVAFEWTVRYYFNFIIILLLIVATCWFTIWLYDRIKAEFVKGTK